jgi:ABC-2 type transport system ATP-binding protein
LKPTSGSASVAGIDVVSDPDAVRTRIGLAGQFAAVDAYQTGRENVEMVGRLYDLSKQEAKRRTEEVLERIDLIDAADRQVKTYSGGMRRRLDLAASMVGRPEVLFLDEPTTGIDPRNRLDIWSLIEDLVEGGTTILLTTQYLDEADQLAARIGVIDRGKLIAEGTADELKDMVGGSVVQLTVQEPDRATVAELLRSVSGDDVSIDQPTGRMSIPAAGSQTLLTVARKLEEASLTPEDIGLRKPTLDDVFLSITGHAAESDEPAPNRPARSRR